VYGVSMYLKEAFTSLCKILCSYVGIPRIPEAINPSDHTSLKPIPKTGQSLGILGSVVGSRGGGGVG